MASKFISYLYLSMSSIAKKDDFRQTTLGELRKLPIPVISKDKQDFVISRVNIILSKKINDINADTSQLEQEIEDYIVKLYL